MSTRLRLILVAILLTGALVVMVVNKQWILITGAEVVIEVVPVDPRSLFRGDFVRLRYKIGQLRYEQVAGHKDFSRKETVHVALRNEGAYWRAVGVYRDTPPPNPGDVIIRGKVVCAATSCLGGDLVLNYGIDRLFVPEGEGHAIEDAQRAGKVAAIIRIGSNGTAMIRGLLVDGELFYEQRLY